MAQTPLEAADALLKTTLERTGIPVSRPPYDGSAAPYITYQLVLHPQTEYADDACCSHEPLWSVDLYTRGPYFALLEAIETYLDSAGFYGFKAGPELYEKDTRLYHIPIDINYHIWRN